MRGIETFEKGKWKLWGALSGEGLHFAHGRNGMVRKRTNARHALHLRWARRWRKYPLSVFWVFSCWFVERFEDRGSVWNVENASRESLSVAWYLLTTWTMREGEWVYQCSGDACSFLLLSQRCTTYLDGRCLMMFAYIYRRCNRLFFMRSGGRLDLIDVFGDVFLVICCFFLELQNVYIIYLYRLGFGMMIFRV